MTSMLFLDDAYLRSTPATVTDITPEGGIILDQTVFYATSGGQPGDRGSLVTGDGTEIEIATAIHPDGDKTRVVHVPVEGQPSLSLGARVEARIDWDRRHRLMRMHTALHLLSVVLPYPVTGGSIGEDKGRLDFDMAEQPSDLDSLTKALNEAVKANLMVTAEWISDDEMLTNSHLIKTMKVKPPIGQGRVRLVRIGDIDLQPCGGTHVRSTGEIGPVVIGKIENKGKQNRRVNLLFA